VAAGTKLFGVGLYALAFEHLALWRLPADAWWVWLAALLGYDLLYYAYHRFGHRVALGWAAHAVHHQSEDYNLSTALRQTSSGFLTSWVFYLPLAVLGVPPLVFGTVALVDLLYQFWVHTQQVGRLGWFDRWFCSPSNHRVHHAVNDRYLDKNYGGILIVWDRLFGTFVEEDDGRALRLRHARAAAQLEPADGQPAGLPCAVGRQPARHALDRQAARVAETAGLAARPTWPRAGPSPASSWQTSSVTTRRSRPRGWRWRAGCSSAVLACTSVLLWNVHRWPPAASVAAGVLIVAVLCGVAALTSGPGSARRSTATVRA
jgi:alkylglycerol monooxygenase